MPPTLASLVHHTALKLTVRTGADRLDVPVRWVHASELADPVPYMEGGELLLITALNLDAKDPGTCRRYVRRLARAGVVGLGFAVGVHYEQVPQALLDAAAAEDLPLIEVPRRTPFIAISKAVSAALAAEQYRAVTAGFAAQRELTRQALADGPERLLAALATQVDGWVALYDASGTVVAAAPAWAHRRAARLTPEVERLRGRPAPASAVVGGGTRTPAGAEDRIELHTLGGAAGTGADQAAGRRPRAALAVGTAAPLGTADRYAVHSAIALLTLTTERSRALRTAEQRIGAAVLRMLLACEPDHARAVAGDLYGGLLDAPYRLIVAEATAAPVTGVGHRQSDRRPPSSERLLQSTHRPPQSHQLSQGSGPSQESAPARHSAPSAGSVHPQGSGPARGSGHTQGSGLPAQGNDPLEALADAVESAAARAGEAVLTVPEHLPERHRLVLVVTDGGAAAQACADHAQALEYDRTERGAEPGAGAGLVVGVSAPAGLASAPDAYRQAGQALSVARRRGRTVVEHAELATGSVLPLLDGDAVRAFAEGQLRALREHDAHGRGDLVASLRAWLAHHGQWDAAAADLGVHRHTLRYRMRRVEEILGRSLDDPDARMELWLALKATTGTD